MSVDEFVTPSLYQRAVIKAYFRALDCELMDNDEIIADGKVKGIFYGIDKNGMIRMRLLNAIESLSVQVEIKA